MKKYLKYCLAIVLLTIIASCGKSFYYAKFDLTNDSNNFNSEVFDIFTTDNNSEVFVRRLYIDSLDGKYSQITLESETGNVKNKLIEVQYLIINDDKMVSPPIKNTAYSISNKSAVTPEIIAPNA